MNVETALVVDYALSALTIAFALWILLRRFLKKGSTADCAKGCASSCGAPVKEANEEAFTDGKVLIPLRKPHAQSP